MTITQADLESLSDGFDAVPERSYTLPARSYVQQGYLDVERDALFDRNWQYVCHAEGLREPGDYVAFEIQGQGLFAIRDRDSELRAFYNVCQHRAHELLSGQGNTRNTITCPYHAWSYHLDGRLRAARRSEFIENFDPAEICLRAVQVEEFCNLVFANLDEKALPLADLSGGLQREIHEYAPDLGQLTHAHRIEYTIKTNWKTAIDNFLECYHCPIAHKDFVSLVDMDTYTVTTHGMYSSHVAAAGSDENTAYDVAGAEVQWHAVWWLWPNICLLRFPGESNFMVLNVVPIDVDTTYETYDFYFQNDTPTAQQWEAIEYVDKVLQREDIDLVESVQRGMRTPAFDRGRFMCDPDGGGLSEHGVHHFHCLYLDAIREYLHSTPNADRTTEIQREGSASAKNSQ